MNCATIEQRLNEDKNLNTGFYENLDKNFEEALNLSMQDFSHEELIEFLKNGNIPQKQNSALKIEELKSSDDAEILINNLTGCDGKIREAVALKINQLVMSNNKYIGFFSQAEIFADASIDINANICRLVIDSVKFLIGKEEFFSKYSAKILKFIDEAFVELDNFIFRDKKYVINKQLFKLYWSLEALKLFVVKIPEEKVLAILRRAMQEKEYTIREKVAQILLLLPENDKISAMKAELMVDENYYVRNVFN